jgi:translation initiation factor IF-2
MRVHELAKELGISSKDLLAKLHQLGTEVASHMTVLEDPAVELMREEFAAPKVEDDLEEEDLGLAPEHHSVKFVNIKPALRVEGDFRSKPQGKFKHQARKKTLPTKDREQPHETPTDAPATGKTITVQGPIVVRDLAVKMGVRPNQLIAELMGMNILASITERIEIAIARKIAEKHGFTLEHEKKASEHGQILKKRTDDESAQLETDKPEDLVMRPPVVTFMGHVDHGKTSLLDKIKNTSVAKGEHGGITQHIGAYTVEIGGRGITFLDTPGHAAFTAMRARGANLTDIAVIIIAADDGIMPQTKEAIQHAQAADVAMMVAINKIDLPSANVDLVKKQLQAEGLTPEDWGGKVICVPVSAQTGEGVEHLLEMILLQADVLELKVNPKRRALGYVIEAQLEPGMGPTANLLVTNGTLKVGDIILCGSHWGRVRALINDHGAKIKSAGPATPVKCMGLSGVPEAGADFRVLTNDKMARDIAEGSMEEARSVRQLSVLPTRKVSLDSLLDYIKEDSKLELKVILKADMQGSLEAIQQALQEIKSEKVALNIILTSAGSITANDVMLASASNAVILGFHVAKEPGVDGIAKHEGVDIRLHQIIYELVDQVRDAMTGLLKPELKERIIGHADIKQVFPFSKTSKVAGCLMTQGHATPKSRVRVKRGNDVLYEGSIASLRHFQNDVSEIKESQECGIRLDKFMGFDAGDTFEFYVLDELERTL